MKLEKGSSNLKKKTEKRKKKMAGATPGLGCGAHGRPIKNPLNRQGGLFY
jgi:hypothetical protein